jgi:hypothetical protein
MAIGWSWSNRQRRDAVQFQPLLYVDTDIVFDRDVTPMLHAIATSDRIAAPLETLSVLSTSPASGAALLQRDLCSPGFLAGSIPARWAFPTCARTVQSCG